MRDIHKNPMLYYLLAPVLAAIWPVLVWWVYLPAAEQQAQDDRALCVEGQTYILDILKYDPERLTFSNDSDVAGEFTFAKAIDRVANLCAIRSSNHSYSVGSIVTSGDKKTQNARVTLTDISIVQVATFLSRIQSLWVNLTCDKIKLTKKKGLPDQWDVEMTFWYSS